MNVFETVFIAVINVQLASLHHRAPRDQASIESFENLLYYQDCTKPKKKPEPREEIKLEIEETTVKPTTVCPCPTVCFSSCCSSFFYNDGVKNVDMQPHPEMYRAYPPILRNEAANVRNVPGLKLLSGPANPTELGTIPPPIKRQLQRKKRVNPLPAGVSFRRHNNAIKGLIEKDADIKKILNDLVKVTLQKVNSYENFERIADEKSEEKEILSSDVIDVNDSDYQIENDDTLN